MSSQYDAVAVRALATITKKGAEVTFARASAGGVYDPATDTWSGGSSSSTVGKAVQIPDDPQRFLALGLKTTDAITLMVAASDLGITPVSGDVFGWAGVFYTAKDCEAIAPDGTPILWLMVGQK